MTTVLVRPEGGVKLAFFKDEKGLVHAVEVSGAALDDKTLCGIENIDVKAEPEEPPDDAEMCPSCMAASIAWARGGTTRIARS